MILTKALTKFEDKDKVLLSLTRRLNTLKIPFTVGPVSTTQIVLGIDDDKVGLFATLCVPFGTKGCLELKWQGGQKVKWIKL